MVVEAGQRIFRGGGAAGAGLVKGADAVVPGN
jgi:hypothetical protein